MINHNHVFKWWAWLVVGQHFWRKMLLWWPLPNYKKSEFSTCWDLSLGHQYLCKNETNIIIRDAIITYKPREEHSPKLLLLYKNYSLINYQNYDQSTGSIQVTLIYTRRTAIWHLCSVHLSTLANREQIWQKSQSCTQLQTLIQIERVCLCIIEQYN